MNEYLEQEIQIIFLDFLSLSFVQNKLKKRAMIKFIHDCSNWKGGAINLLGDFKKNVWKIGWQKNQGGTRQIYERAEVSSGRSHVRLESRLSFA